MRTQTHTGLCITRMGGKHEVAEKRERAENIRVGCAGSKAAKCTCSKLGPEHKHEMVVRWVAK